jgi:hypothetical protein
MGFPFTKSQSPLPSVNLLPNEVIKCPTKRKLIFDFFVEKQDALKCDLQSLVYNGAKFSKTADECTDINNRRYLNVTLQKKRPYKLGLVKIAGSCNVEKTQVVRIWVKIQGYCCINPLQSMGD